MRRHICVSSLFACLFAVALTTHAQDPGKIIDQYIKASGGAKALSRIQTLTLEGAFSNPADGKPGTYTLSAKQPNRYYSELRTADKTLIEAYNGKSAWHHDAAGEISTLLGPEALQLEAAAQFYNAHLLNLKKSKVAAAFVGHAQVRGRDALQLEILWPTGVKRELFFDPQSHLIVQDSALLAGISADAMGLAGAMWLIAGITFASGVVSAVRMDETSRLC